MMEYLAAANFSFDVKLTEVENQMDEPVCWPTGTQQNEHRQYVKSMRSPAIL
jgi:hypothetical protein